MQLSKFHIESELIRYKGKKGLYFVYDSSKNLIYMGYSESCIYKTAKRVMQASSQRFTLEGEEVFFRIATLGKKADLKQICLSLVFRLKPYLNKSPKEAPKEAEGSFLLYQRALLMG